MEKIECLIIEGENAIITAEEFDYLMAQAERAEEANHMRQALDIVYELAGWHTDDDADPDDHRPEDMTAHINGLIRKICMASRKNAIGSPARPERAATSKGDKCGEKETRQEAADAHEKGQDAVLASR